MQSTPAFEARLDELTQRFDRRDELLAFLLRLQACHQITSQDVHRWPLFDIHEGRASYRAVVGVFTCLNMPRQFVVYYEKRPSGTGALAPLYIWADDVDPT